MLFQNTFRSKEAQLHAADISLRNRRIEATRLLEDAKAGNKLEWGKYGLLVGMEIRDIVSYGRGEINVDSMNVLAKRALGLTDL